MRESVRSLGFSAAKDKRTLVRPFSKPQVFLYGTKAQYEFVRVIIRKRSISLGAIITLYSGAKEVLLHEKCGNIAVSRIYANKVQ